MTILGLNQSRLVLGICVALFGCTTPPIESNRGAPRAKVVVRSAHVESVLPGRDRDVVLRQLRRLASSCSIDSMTHPAVFSETGNEAWDRVISGAHLVAVLPSRERFAWLIGDGEFVELLLELPKGSYVGLLLGRGPAGIVQFSKCDGGAAIELACLAELAPLLPATYSHTCRFVSTRQLERGWVSCSGSSGPQ